MRRFLFSLFIILTSGLMMAGTGNNSVTVKPDGNDLLLTFNLPTLHIELMTAHGKQFQRIVLDKAGTTSTVGQAELPLFAVNIALPGSTLPEIMVLEKSKRELILKHPVYPVQMPWPKNRPLSERPFSMDSDWYNATHMNPELVSAGQLFVIRGTAGTSVVIRPFNYNPVINDLTVVDHLVIRLHFTDTTKGYREPSAPAFKALFHRIFANHEEMEKPEAGLMKVESGTKDVLRKYLIITAPEFESALSGFVAHKQSLSYAVTVVTTTVTGATTTAIKSYLQGMYDDLATRPEFVLLVGDTDKIPAWTSTQLDNPRNDLYYATLEGTDYFPDVFLGRFSVSSSDELQNIISKTIYMESHLAELPKKVLFMASNDNSPITEATHNYVDTNYFGPDGYNSTKLYNRLNPGTSATTSAINGGERYAVYSGHGDWNYWADGPVFYQDNVRALINDIYPFVFSFACLTGKYDSSECFGETWIRVANGGTTFWGSSVYSYWNEDDVLEKGVFKAAFTDGLDQICPMFNAGKMALYDHYAGGGSSKRYFEQYNLMGDPSVYTKGSLPNSSKGRILLDASKVACNGQVTVQVWDSDLESMEFFNITVENPGRGTSRTIELYKFDSGKFAGMYPFSVQGLDPGVSGSGELVFHYADEHYGDEGPKDVTATLPLDCDSPVLMHQEIEAARATSGDVSLYFDEKCYADVTVKNGSTIITSTSENGVDSVQLNLTGLSPQTAYTVDLQLTDELGNTSTFVDVPLFTTPAGSIAADYPCDNENEATHSADVGTDVWSMTSTTGAHSNGLCWFGEDVPSITDASLVVGPVTLSSGAGSVLSFWHYYDLESTYDGGVLEISTNGGTGWLDIGSDIQSGGYDTVMAGSALEDQMAWTGTNDAMSQVFVDLSAFSGQTVSFRFRIACDSSVNQTGWYVDDIAVTSLSDSPEPFTFLNLTSDSILTLNAAEEAANVVLTARDADGEVLGTKSVSLNPYSVLNGSVETIFDPVDVSGVATVEALPDAFVAGWQMQDFEDARGPMRNWTPAFRGGGKPAVVVPHVASDIVHGELYWNTWVSVMNSGSSAEGLQFTYTPPFLPFRSDAQVPSLGFIHSNVESDIFGNNFPDSGVGFASLALPDTASGELMGVKAMESFDKKTIANSAQLTLDMKAGKELFVAHVDNTDYWWTGIALDNLSTTATAAVSVSGYTNNGVLSQQKQYAVDPGGKLIFVTKTEFTADVAWFKVESSLPLIGYELFGTTNNLSMAGLNIPTSGSKDIFLPIVDVGLANDWYGLTVVNTNETAVTVTLHFYRNGVSVGQSTASLNALSKSVGLLSDYFAGETDLIEITATGKVVAFCLEGKSDHSTLGGVLGMAR
ncbi:MAG: hypothetical protein GXO70_04530 [Acidobacteria bacterium]|nr:hypothetical protein [Acidobacteriota bacterium]